MAMEVNMNMKKKSSISVIRTICDDVIKNIRPLCNENDFITYDISYERNDHTTNFTVIMLSTSILIEYDNKCFYCKFYNASKNEMIIAFTDYEEKLIEIIQKSIITNFEDGFVDTIFRQVIKYRKFYINDFSKVIFNSCYKFGYTKIIDRLFFGLHSLDRELFEIIMYGIFEDYIEDTEFVALLLDIRNRVYDQSEDLFGGNIEL